VQLVSKFSNLCDHNPPTLQTDRQTDTLQCNQRRNRGDLIETYYKILTGKERVDSQTGHRYSQRARAFEEIVCSNNGSKVILRHESDQQSKCVATTCSQCTIDKCFQEQTEQWTDMGAWKFRLASLSTSSTSTTFKLLTYLQSFCRTKPKGSLSILIDLIQYSNKFALTSVPWDPSPLPIVYAYRVFSLHTKS